MIYSKTIVRLALLSTAIIGLIHFQGWQVQGEVKNVIFDADKFWILNSDEIIVNDRAIRESPIRRISFAEDNVINSLRSGRGPGEVSPIFYKGFTKFGNGNLLLWDAGLNRITRYSDELELIADVRVEIPEKMYQALLVNDSTLVTLTFSDHFLKAWRFNGNRIGKEDLLWQKSAEDVPELFSLESFVMQQTVYYSNLDGVLYFAFEFSSLLVAIDEEGVKYISDGPDQIPIPSPYENGINVLPDVAEDFAGARDISVDDKYVYVVFSGKKVSQQQLKSYASKIDELLEVIEHAERLWIFDKHTGEFIREVKLPIAAKKMQVGEGYAYLLNTIEKVPRVIKYELPKDLLTSD